ncbi:MAG: hypothetical protein U0263_35495 [Polyangiaceae bacterium]
MLLTLGGGEEAASRTELSVRDPLARLPVEVAVVRVERVDPKTVIDPPEGAGIFARVFIDVSNPDQALLFFSDERNERILIRKVALARGLDEVEREELAQIVRSAVEALLSGAEIGIARADARAELLPETARAEAAPPPRPRPPAPPPLRPNPPPAPAARFEPGAFYAAELQRDRFWQGPGLDLGVSWGSAPAFGALASLAYRAPMTLEDEALGVRLQAFALRLLPSASFDLGSVLLSGRIGPGVNLTHFEPIRLRDRGVPGDAHWDLTYVVTLAGEGGVPVSGIALRLLAGLDADLVETRYVAVDNGSERTLFDAPRLRPWFAVGISTRP